MAARLGKSTERNVPKSSIMHLLKSLTYDNRLPRGRTLVRNGSVCHLAIKEGCVEGIVVGSELYQVQITIKALSSEKWKGIQAACVGKIDTLLGLLRGELSAEVMQKVCDHHAGLFPQAKEIELSCNCPDWAHMCKHIAAVLYGIGARLDHTPEKLFELRAVDCHELINTESIAIDTTTISTRRRLDPSAIAGVFDIDFVEVPEETQDKGHAVEPIEKFQQDSDPKRKETNTQRANTISTSNKNDKSNENKQNNRSKKSKQTLPLATIMPETIASDAFTGLVLRKKRKALNLTQKRVAQQIGVSASMLSLWENIGANKLPLRAQVKRALLQVLVGSSRMR